jgi:uncharacterized protein YjbI with pentapeptide repeats
VTLDEVPTRSEHGLGDDVLAVTASQQDKRVPRRWRARPESWWWISAVVLVPVALLTGLAALVLATTTHPATAGDQINLVRTALSVGAGTGGVVALVLASRRQWHAEQAQRGTEHDATERRITDLYTKAADQLGSDKAPVRLAGLYALERLAQDNPGQRQTIVNVICAYLRMPFTPPEQTPPASDAPGPEHARFEQRAQEHQVRLTAQRILPAHLNPGQDPDHPVTTFWHTIDLDLTGATLTDFDLVMCHLGDTRFDRAYFAGNTAFSAAYFDGYAEFGGAQFAGDTTFFGAHFATDAQFAGAQFADDVWLIDAYFGGAGFAGAQFAGDARFDGAQFASGARFAGAQFAGDAGFAGAQFVGGAHFDTAVAISGRCWVRMDVSDYVAHERVWPAGWAVVSTAERPRPDAKGEWGRLVPDDGNGVAGQP